MSSLTDKFQHFVGKSVKNPQRLTCDICPTTEALREEARANGLMVSFNIVGNSGNKRNSMISIPRLMVELQKNDDGQLVIDSLDVG